MTSVDPAGAPRVAQSAGRSLRSLVFFTFLLTGLPPSLCTEWSSSGPPLPPSDPADPFYAPLSSPEDLQPSLDSNSVLVTSEDVIATRNSDAYDDVIKDGGHQCQHGDVTGEDRKKRSSGNNWDESKPSSPPPPRRVKTGDTILNIRGAVRDSIGDAGAAPSQTHRAASMLDAFVIRPQPSVRYPLQDQPILARSTQSPNYDRELLVEAHSKARIPCELKNLTSYRWYKDNEQISAAQSSRGGESLWQEGSWLVIGRATRADAAAWRCAGVDGAGKMRTGKPTSLLIYEPVRSVYLAIDGRRLDAGNTWIPVREKTILEVRCVAEGGVPPPELSWRLITPEATLDHRPYLRTHYTNHSISGVSWSHVIVTAARELHNASLICAAQQRHPTDTRRDGDTHTDTDTAATDGDDLTAKLEIRVTYPPSFVISRWPGFGVGLASGAAAALRCDVDANPPARAWWLRDDAHANSSPPPDDGSSEPGGSSTLRWSELRLSHAGWYRCRATWLDAEYSSIGYYLNVMPTVEGAPIPTAESPVEEPEQQNVEVPLGGHVQLNCPKGSVGCWWRRVVGNNSSEEWPPASDGRDKWAPAGSKHAHGVLGIKDAMYQEGGEYRCIGARAPDVDTIRELKRVTLKVTGAATATALSAEPFGGGWRLECGACGRGVRVLWLRGGEVQPASLSPDLAQHCWRAVLHVAETDEVWCVASSAAGGSVAVFPPRARAFPSPAPAPHSVRAPYSAATTAHKRHYTLAAILVAVLARHLI